jgi:hypothetical protein
MSLDKPYSSLTPSEKVEVATNLANAKAYGNPRRVWVEDGHVFVEGHDGDIITMTPEIAITMGRLLSNAGADALVNNVTDKHKPVVS